MSLERTHLPQTELADYDQSLTITDIKIDAETGLTLQRVHVPDVSEFSPTLVERQQAIAASDELLKENVDWLAPVDLPNKTIELQNPVSEWVYETSPTMNQWRAELVPNAEALIPMQRPDITHLPMLKKVDESGEVVAYAGGGEVDDIARSFFTDALDSIGIRTRAKIMSDIAKRHIGTADKAEWVSLACGAALPVLEALKESTKDIATTHLHLYDINPGTLITARELASEYDLVEGGQYTTYARNLITDVIVTDRLVQERGEESATMVDALGIFEYFNDKRCEQFLSNAYRLVKPGGALVIANMLEDRPELDFNQRGIGWPKIYPRSLESLTSLVEQAGLPLEQTVITIPQDGVYAVVEISK